jgi:hypothetical protein
LQPVKVTDVIGKQNEAVCCAILKMLRSVGACKAGGLRREQLKALGL